MLLALLGRCKQQKMQHHTPTSIFYPFLKKIDRAPYPRQPGPNIPFAYRLTPSISALLTFSRSLFSKFIKRGAKKKEEAHHQIGTCICASRKLKPKLTPGILTETGSGAKNQNQNESETEIAIEAEVQVQTSLITLSTLNLTQISLPAKHQTHSCALDVVV